MTTDTTIRGKLGTYYVIKPLKSGGMGEVLLARDEMDRRIAIKRPFASAVADGLARFELEGKAAMLEHRNIAKIYEDGVQPDGRPYLAMEFVDGKELKDIIESGEPLDLLDKLSIIEQVCAGLGYAHRKGFVHRDIKPGNVMVQPNGVAKIIDFGIAKIIDMERTSDLTQTAGVIGSLHYIAPERFKNEAMDGRVDVFSAGVMLYLLLTGKLPFSGGELTAQYQIVNEAPTRLGAHLQDYPPALDEIIERALAKNPDDRFATAEDFADALHDVIESVKRSRVNRLFEDAERLTVETRYEAALERLDEAIKLDDSNTQVRKLRKLVREHQDRRKKAERVREYLTRAEELLTAENYAAALAQLKDAARVDSTSEHLKQRIAQVETAKHRYERSAAALAAAEAAKIRGDVTAALRISEEAIQYDPDNTKLLALRAAIAKQLESEKQRARLTALFDAARGELLAKNYPQVERLLQEAEAVDRTHPNIEGMRREMAQIREREELRQFLEKVHQHVNDFLRADNYEQASELLTRAIERLPDETVLHRLKLEVDTAAQRFDSARFVDRAVFSAQEAFATDPQKAMSILHEALQHMPTDERLITTERSLRQQAEALRVKQLLDACLRSAREFITAEQFDKAIDVLERYQLEHGAQSDVEALLTLSRKEQEAQRRALLVERTTAEARSLIGSERLDEAATLLERALQSTAIRQYGDVALSGLLEDVRAQQLAAERKREAVIKHAVTHRELGELDTAIQILNEYLATGAHNPEAESLLSSLQTEKTRGQVTKQAITAADQSTKQGNFTAALESLQAVVRAYAESDELTQAIERVKQARRAHAQQVVSKSIDTSRAALLAGDVAGALTALRTANEMVEFADADKQSDWRRIGQAAKKAQSEPTGTVIADPLAALPEASSGKKTSPVLLVAGILAACLVLGVVGFFLSRRSAPVAPVATDAHIRIGKAPSGALVSIDGGAGQQTDAHGSLELTVSPGSHTLEVTKEGFSPYDEKFQVDAGATFVDNIALTKLPPVNNSGTLVMQSNLPAFKVIIDDHPRGQFKNQGSLALEAGQHTIQYSNEDGSDTSPKHTVLIVAGKTFDDSFKLKEPSAPPPTPSPSAAPGSIVVETNPNALVSIDGQARGRADSSGTLTVNGLTAANHTIDINLDGYQPVTGRPVTVVGGQKASFRQPLSANAPSTGSLSVRTTAGAQVSLNNGQGGTADGAGNLDLGNLKPGTYSLDISKDGYQPAHMDGVTIVAGSKTPFFGPLTAKAVAPPPPPQPANVPAADDHSADYKGIQAAVSNFAAAFQSRKMDQLKGAWLNAGSQAKNLTTVFETAEMVKMSARCVGQPAITGDTATQRCEETTQYSKGDPARTNPFTYTFVKTVGKWVLRDRVSVR